MRRFFKTVSILLMCGTLCCPVAEGRGRNNGQGGASQPHQSTQQAPQRNNNQGNQRPGGNQGGQQPGNQRPGNNSGNQGNHSQGNQRPGNNSGNQGNHSQGNQRPGNNSGNRPHSGNVGPQHGYQGNGHGPATPPPGGGHAPNPGHGTPPPPPGGYNHGYAPGHGHHPNYGYGSPHRPNLPPPAPWQRPTPPPPGYRPYSGPSISTILGVALGTTIYYALDNLGSRGYNVVGYGNDAIYLSNVTQLGMNWPDATLYYVNGQLAASEFVYGQGYYDMSRYYNAYGMLASTYGYPTSTSNYGQGGQRASWWSPSGQFITLTYSAATSYEGNTRYYTILSFGN